MTINRKFINYMICVALTFSFSISGCYQQNDTTKNSFDNSESNTNVKTTDAAPTKTPENTVATTVTEHAGKAIGNLFHEYALNNIVKDATSVMSLSPSYSDLNLSIESFACLFYDLTEDGVEDPIVCVDDGSYYLIYIYENNTFRMIYHNISGAEGYDRYLVKDGDTCYFAEESFSSGDGFMLSYLHFNPKDNSKLVKHYSNIVLEEDTEYQIDGKYVSESEYNAFRKDVIKPDEFVPLSED